ncbi:MAG: hypothetical protein QXS22_06320 [Acidilobaceae archaeon]
MLRVKRQPEDITVEIITISPIMIGHCGHCEILTKEFGIDYKVDQIKEYPEEIIEMSSKITEFIRALTRKSYVKVIIIETLTPYGLLKMMRHRGGKLPVIIINGIKIWEGNIKDPEALAHKAYEITLKNKST